MDEPIPRFKLRTASVTIRQRRKYGMAGRYVMMSDGSFATTEELGDAPSREGTSIRKAAKPERPQVLVAVSGKGLMNGLEWVQNGSPPGQMITKLYSLVSERPNAVENPPAT